MPALGITQLRPNALAGARYQSFAGRAEQQSHFAIYGAVFLVPWISVVSTENDAWLDLETADLEDLTP